MPHPGTNANQLVTVSALPYNAVGADNYALCCVSLLPKRCFCQNHAQVNEYSVLDGGTGVKGLTRLGDPPPTAPRYPGAVSAQRQGWETQSGPPGGCTAGRSPWDKQIHGT